MTNEKLLEIGRAVHKLLTAERPGQTGQTVLVFELFDHKRRLCITELNNRIWASHTSADDIEAEEVKFDKTFS